MRSLFLYIGIALICFSITVAAFSVVNKEERRPYTFEEFIEELSVFNNDKFSSIGEFIDNISNAFDSEELKEPDGYEDLNWLEKFIVDVCMGIYRVVMVIGSLVTFIINGLTDTLSIVGTFLKLLWRFIIGVPIAV